MADQNQAKDSTTKGPTSTGDLRPVSGDRSYVILFGSENSAKHDFASHFKRMEHFGDWVAYAYESGGYEATLLKAPDYLPDLSNPSAYLEGVVFPVALFPKHGHTFGFIYFSPETDDSPQHSSKDNSEGSTAEPVTLDDCYMRLMIELCGRRFMPQTVILSPKLLEADKLTTWIGKTKPRQTAAKHGADFKTFTGDTMVANEIIASLLAKYEGLKEKEYMKIQWEMWMRKSPLSETGFWKYYSKAWVAPNDDPDPVKNKNRLTELEEELLTK